MKETVLIIEDDKDFAESLKLRIEDSNPSVSVEIRDFESALNELQIIIPDVVILDVFEGEPHYEDRRGLPIWNRIWEQSFVPLIFASALRLEELLEYADKHPLIRYILKFDAGAMDQIVEDVHRFLPFGSGIKRIRTVLCSDAEQSIQKALTETALHALGNTTAPDEGLPILKSSARRRLAVLMRLKSEEERSHIFAWEQYLHPSPDVPYLLTGDILALSSGDQSGPESFRVVLTPSCDLAQNNVDYVLVGKCVPLKEFCSKNTILPLKRKAKDKLSSMLTQAQSNGYVVLPAYSNLIPPMAVSLRRLELLEIMDGIRAKSVDGNVFERVISIDNPFREQLSWAYLQIAGRPGMPDRNRDAWIKEISSALARKRT